MLRYPDVVVRLTSDFTICLSDFDSLTQLHAREENRALRRVDQPVTNKDAEEEVGSLYYHRTICTHVRRQFHKAEERPGATG